MKPIDFDQLLNQLSLEEKIAQMLVFAVSGTVADLPLIDFMRKYGLGGLRISPTACRKASSYVNSDSIAAVNSNRQPEWGEKLFDNSIIPRNIGTCEYAEFLNKLRQIGFERRELGLPVHVVADFESGGGNFTPRGIVNLPAPLGFGDLGDMQLIEDTAEILAKQIKAIGIDWIHSPVVDVNIDPRNPEIQIRSYGNNPKTVSQCASALLRGLKKGNVIGSLKHFPGRGDSAEDAHFKTNVIQASIEDLYNIHIKPYQDLIESKQAESVMIAHTIYPNLDSEIATVSEKIIGGILRNELGFNGVITTDSLTMGGLMERFTVSEACIRTINAGSDLMLMKAENSLRYELHHDLCKAVMSGRIKVSLINAAVKRIWSLKHSYGLFENGGIVDSRQAVKVMENPYYYQKSLETSHRVRKVLRDRENLLPLNKNQKLLIADRITRNQIYRNNDWNYPGMFYDFLLKHTENFTYIDYLENNINRAMELAERFAGEADIIIVTAEYNRNDILHNGKEFVKSLLRFGKPVVMIANNPYRELLVPDEIGTVIITYELAREQLVSVADFLFEQ